MRRTGWIMLIAGGIGIIITAFVFRSDWPMYASMIIATAGATMVCWKGSQSRKPTGV